MSEADPPLPPPVEVIVENIDGFPDDGIADTPRGVLIPPIPPPPTVTV
jgi:hypothetical protein